MLSVKDVGYWYENKDNSLYENVNLSFEPGKMYAILGSSGSGKTTFLSLIAGLDKPKEGTILYNDKEINKIGLTNYRKKYVSIVFQSYNLLPYMTATQNITTAMEISGSIQPTKKEYATKLLDSVGIDNELAQKKVTKLSGGQQQRVAIIRAMCCDHDLIVADEPTGNLDEKTSKDIVQFFEKIAHTENKCIIIVTHEKEVADACDHIFELKHHEFQVIK